jgi:hypothetical protein
MLIVICRERLPGLDQQLDQRVLAGACHAGDCTDAHALDHHAEDLRALFVWEPVHRHIYMTHYAYRQAYLHACVKS